MAQENNSDLRKKFKRGLRPTESDFIDLIDSTLQKPNFDAGSNTLSFQGGESLDQDSTSLASLHQGLNFDDSSKILTTVPSSTNSTGADLSGFLWAPNANGVTIDNTSNNTLNNSSAVVPTMQSVKTYVDDLNADALNFELCTLRSNWNDSTTGYGQYGASTLYNWLSGNHTDPFGLYGGSTSPYVELYETGNYEFAVRMRFNYTTGSTAASIGAVKVYLRTYLYNSSWPASTAPTSQHLLFSNQGYNTRGTNGEDVQMYQRLNLRLSHKTRVALWFDIGTSSSIRVLGSHLNMMTVKKLINTADNNDYNGNWAQAPLTQVVGSLGNTSAQHQVPGGALPDTPA